MSKPKKSRSLLKDNVLVLSQDSKDRIDLLKAYTAVETRADLVNNALRLYGYLVLEVFDRGCELYVGHIDPIPEGLVEADLFVGQQERKEKLGEKS